jgi:hypothetical protein
MEATQQLLGEIHGREDLDRDAKCKNYVEIFSNMDPTAYAELKVSRFG